MKYAQKNRQRSTIISAATICIVFYLSLGTSSAEETSDASTKITAELVSVEKIWDAAPHNAFTDLIRHDGKFYCAFREGTGHVPGNSGSDGKARVIVSKDGKTWTSIALLEKEEVDLRDPKLSAMPDGSIIIVMGGSYYEGTKLLKRIPQVAFLRPGETKFSPVQPIRIEPKVAGNNDWLWRVTWHKGVGYGVTYQPDRTPWGLHLLKTMDGIHFDLVATLDVPGRPNETTVRFTDSDELILVVRNEDGRPRGNLGRAAPPYRDFTWTDLEHKLGGPNFLPRADGSLLLGSRDYTSSGAKTSLGLVSPSGEYHNLIQLPSGGDTSYPGMLFHDGLLWFSYYSSHAGRTSIYLAEIRIHESSN